MLVCYCAFGQEESESEGVSKVPPHSSACNERFGKFLFRLLLENNEVRSGHQRRHNTELYLAIYLPGLNQKVLYVRGVSIAQSDCNFRARCLFILSSVTSSCASRSPI